jgi:hypothetical protein
MVYAHNHSKLCPERIGRDMTSKEWAGGNRRLDEERVARPRGIPTLPEFGSAPPMVELLASICSAPP